jgi:hypothetical protein
MALVLLQGLWRLTHKSLMRGECCCSGNEQTWFYSQHFWV